MRIGILTFHYAHNYGAVLQCYALQEYLKSAYSDAEVEVIDYRCPAIANGYKWHRGESLFSKNPLKSIKTSIRLLRNKIRFEAFETFIKTKLNLASVSTIFDNPYDIIIIGSDQVWNYNLTGGFDNYYWGEFKHPESTRIASYAASMQDSWSDNLSLKISTLLGNFNMISVRESTLAKKIQSLTGRQDIYHVVDPTLLIDSSKWNALAIKPHIKNPYLLLFQVEGNNPKTEQIAIQIAHIKKLAIVRLSTFVTRNTPWNLLATSPQKFIGLFKFADYIVCSSFHGTIFSLQFNKPFVSVKMGKGKDNRVGAFLNMIGLQHRFVDRYDTNIEQSDYTPKISEIEHIKELSQHFISDLIKDEKGLDN